VIVRTWGGRVPAHHAAGFQRHLLVTGIADCRAQPGCIDIRLLRREQDGWTHFLLLSTWHDVAAIEAFAGAISAVSAAVLYPGDETFGLDPDREAVQYELVDIDPDGGGLR
jgi:quinol monooxygenase YgiN